MESTSLKKSSIYSLVTEIELRFSITFTDQEQISIKSTIFIFFNKEATQFLILTPLPPPLALPICLHGQDFAVK
jgi:hypothetical protein